MNKNSLEIIYVIMIFSLYKAKLYSTYLTIRPVARKGYRSIAHEAKLNGLLTLGGGGYSHIWAI